MNTPDVKGVSELIKSVGSAEEQRQAFGRTFFGTLLGQTVVLAGLLLIYIGSAAVIWRYGSKDLKTFHSDVGEWFWLIFAAPLICILLFSMRPTASLAWRERRLKAAAIGGDALKPSIWHRSLPLVAPAVLLGWIALAIIALPSWIAFEESAAEAGLRKLGANFSEAKSGGLLVELPTQTSDDDLIKEVPLLERLNVAHLYLPLSTFASLEPLKRLTNLSSLNLSNASGITSLEPLKELTNLGLLDLSYATGITSLEPLKGLTNLSSLDLRNDAGVTNLEPLKGLTNLGSLNLNSATGVTSLEPLKGLANLSISAGSISATPPASRAWSR
jgi:hypothetical protein